MGEPPQWSSTWALLGIILPPLVAAVGGIAFRRSRRQGQWLGFLSVGASVISFLSSVGLALAASGVGFSLQFHILVIDIYVDALSAYFILLVNLVAFFASFYTIHFLESEGLCLPSEAKSSVQETANWFHRFVRWLDWMLSTPRGFHVLFNLFHTSMLLVSMMDNLVLLWIFIEITTMVSAPLVSYRQRREARDEAEREAQQAAQEAAWKYILLSSAGILFALLGTIFLASAFPADTVSNINWSSLKDLARTLGQNGDLAPGLVKLSFLLVWLGYGTKAGLFPMHTWLPDGHGQAPSPVSALLSGVLLKSALYAILRFYVITNAALTPAAASKPDPFASNILLLSGLLSLVMATPFILKKKNRFKRVLAYHSLEHMGIITFGLGLGGATALFGALFHALNHALTKALMFLAYGNIQIAYRNAGLKEEQIEGVFYTMPATGYVLALGGVALVGSPPFNLFFSELIILGAAVENAAGDPLRIAAISLFLISIMAIFAGLVVHLGRIVLGDGPTGQVRERRWQPVLLWVMLLLILYLGVTADPLVRLLDQSVAVLCQEWGP